MPDDLDPTALPNGDTTDPEAALKAGTGDSEAAPDAEGAKSKDGDGTPENETAEAKATRLEEEAVEARVQAKLDVAVEAKLAERDKAQAAETTNKALTRSFSDVAQKVEASLTGLKINAHDQAGNPIVINLSKEQVQAAVLNDLNGYHTTVKATLGQEFANELAEAALGALPDEQRAAFEKWATEGNPKDLPAWMTRWSEDRAPHTKAWEQRAKDHEAALKQARLDGFKEGAKSPNPPGQQDTKNTTKLTREEFERMSPADRAKAWSDRPDEVRAL